MSAAPEQGAPGRPQGLVIVGVDGSDSSVEALRLALRIAPALDARIEATACWEEPGLYDGRLLPEIVSFEQRAAQILDRALVAAYGASLPPHVTPRLIAGSPRPVLIEASKGADLLVLGRRGHGGFHGLQLGSVSVACVTRAHCPVLVIREPDASG